MRDGCQGSAAAQHPMWNNRHQPRCTQQLHSCRAAAEGLKPWANQPTPSTPNSLGQVGGEVLNGAGAGHQGLHAEADEGNLQGGSGGGRA